MPSLVRQYSGLGGTPEAVFFVKWHLGAFYLSFTAFHAYFLYCFVLFFDRICLFCLEGVLQCSNLKVFLVRL